VNLLNEPALEDQPLSEGKKNVVVSDFFGFGKIIDKLNLGKFNARMTYCVLVPIIIFSFFGLMYKTKTKAMDFPTLLDMRVMSIVCAIVFFAGIWDKIRTPKTNSD
jgi:hypothetical protein